MTPTPRLTLLAAVAALALVGCQKSPFAWTLDFVPTIAAGKPTAPGAAPSAGATPAPGATASPGTATPAPPAPTDGTPAPAGTPTPAAVATPLAEPSFAPLAPTDPLPSATTISDLPPAEQQAVTQALASDEVLAFLPDQLIHDGGVVLYRTLAVEQPRLQVGTQPADRPKGPPPKWAREEQARSGAQTVARQIPCPPNTVCAADLPRPVNVVVRYHQKSAFSFKNADGQLVSKPYGELFRRRLEFERQPDQKLKLRALSPITIESQGGRSGLEIGQIHLFGTPPEPLFVLRDDDRSIPADRQPRLRVGERGRIEVDVQSRRLGEFFVFASMAGQGPDKRVFLRDDGQAPDAVAGDYRYSGAFEVPDKAGLNHLVVDVMDAKTFLPIGPYRSYSLAFSFWIDGR